MAGQIGEAAPDYAVMSDEEFLAAYLAEQHDRFPGD